MIVLISPRDEPVVDCNMSSSHFEDASFIAAHFIQWDRSYWRSAKPHAPTVVPNISVLTNGNISKNTSETPISRAVASIAPTETSSLPPQHSSLAPSTGRSAHRWSDSQPVSSHVAACSSRTVYTATLSYQNSFQYLHNFLAHYDAEFDKMNYKPIQRKLLVTTLETRPEEVREQLERVVVECAHLRSANATFLGRRDHARRNIATLHARRVNLEALAQFPSIPSLERYDACR